MEKLNKYGKLSGGAIFDYYDRIVHEKAIERIGECVTSSSEVKFLKQVDNLKLLSLYNNHLDVIHIGKKYCIIQITSYYFSGIFTFIKI